MTKLSHLLLSIICCCLITACNQKSDLTIAEPASYDALPDAQLGTNENDKGLAPGTKLSAVNLKTINGKSYDLADAWQHKPALIIFYRGGWCPYCNMQVKKLSDNYAKFVEAGIEVVLISVDKPNNATLTQAAYDIPFPVLSDSQLAAINVFNVAKTLHKDALKMYQEHGIIPSDWSGKNHNTIAIASTFIVDTQGIVRMSHAPDDFKTRPSVEQLLAMVGLLKL